MAEQLEAAAEQEAMRKVIKQYGQAIADQRVNKGHDVDQWFFSTVAAQFLNYELPNEEGNEQTRCICLFAAIGGLVGIGVGVFICFIVTHEKGKSSEGMNNNVHSFMSYVHSRHAGGPRRRGLAAMGIDGQREGQEQRGHE
jgi:hypothetical protein